MISLGTSQKDAPSTDAIVLRLTAKLFIIKCHGSIVRGKHFDVIYQVFAVQLAMSMLVDDSNSNRQSVV